MAIAYKILGQSAPSATTNTDVYTVPSATEAIVNTIAICNRGNSQGSYRIAVRPDGASIANQHYFVYDTVINANDTVNPDITLSLNAGDVITVYASSANFSFLVSGVEITE
jgi:glucose-6-phosphate dehydrogenase assembly protein OpcA